MMHTMLHMNEKKGHAGSVATPVDDGEDYTDPNHHLKDIAPSELPQILQIFLLMSDADGEENERMNSTMTYFVPLLLAKPDHRQMMCIAIGELNALLGGLLLAVVLSHKMDARESPPSWGTTTTAADWVRDM